MPASLRRMAPRGSSRPARRPSAPASGRSRHGQRPGSAMSLRDGRGEDAGGREPHGRSVAAVSRRVQGSASQGASSCAGTEPAGDGKAPRPHAASRCGRRPGAARSVPGQRPAHPRSHLGGDDRGRYPEIRRWPLAAVEPWRWPLYRPVPRQSSTSSRSIDTPARAADCRSIGSRSHAGRPSWRDAVAPQSEASGRASAVAGAATRWARAAAEPTAACPSAQARTPSARAHGRSSVGRLLLLRSTARTSGRSSARAGRADVAALSGAQRHRQPHAGAHRRWRRWPRRMRSLWHAERR